MKLKLIIVAIVALLVLSLWWAQNSDQREVQRDTASNTVQGLSKVMNAKEVLMGRWQRHDGNYSIEIGDLENPSGPEVKYFNPNPVSVLRPVVTRIDGDWVVQFEL
ncbi:MAG: hypothetical protein ACPGYJ_04260, partial [bacterium]